VWRCSPRLECSSSGSTEPHIVVVFPSNWLSFGRCETPPRKLQRCRCRTPPGICVGSVADGRQGGDSAGEDEFSPRDACANDTANLHLPEGVRLFCTGWQRNHLERSFSPLPQISYLCYLVQLEHHVAREEASSCCAGAEGIRPLEVAWYCRDCNQFCL
jgi:hypothetical protein